MRTSIVAAALVALAPAASAERVSPRVDLALSLVPAGSALDLRFANGTSAPVTIQLHDRAESLAWDALTIALVEQTTGEARTLHFSPRERATDKAYAETAVIPAFGQISQHVELALWALEEGNGGPLAPGRYHAVAIWNGTGPAAHLVASTDLTIAAPVDKPCTMAPAEPAAVQLLAHQVGTTSVIEVGLHNIGTTDACVASSMVAGELQSDWLHFELGTHVIALTGPRRAVARVTTVLAPGATSWVRFDLDAWARRDHLARLARGAQGLAAIYDSSHERDVWAGVARTDINVVLR